MSAHWDEEIRRIERHAAHFATAHKATATFGVAVDDERKRDYFVPRLQKIADDNTWAAHLTFRVVPMNGGKPIDVRKTVTSPAAWPDIEYIKAVCKIGQGHACCRYLLAGPNGFECAKVDPPVRNILDRRVAAEMMTARGDNCEGRL